LVRAALRNQQQLSTNLDPANFLKQFTYSPKGGIPHQCLWLPYNDPSFQWWTENHTFILLTTAALMCDTTDPDRDNLITLLCEWLRGHYDGTNYFIFEINSPPYTMHTMECLFLLYDFPISSEIQELAQGILNQVINEIIAVSLCNGSWLSAAARMYPKNRLPSTDTNGTSEPPSLPTQLYAKIYGQEFTGQSLGDWKIGDSLSSNYLGYALDTTNFPFPSSAECDATGVVKTLFGSPDPTSVNFVEMPFNWLVLPLLS
jgi:hypothetical protein